MNRAVQVVREARLLSPRQLAFRLRYELINRTGLRRRLKPIVHTPPDLPDLPTRDDWLAGLPDDHWLVTLGNAVFTGRARDFLTSRLDNDQQSALLARAEDALQGKIRCYSHSQADYGFPVDWHFSPSRGRRWPADVHWSKIYDHARTCGDIKDVWELNRFPHLYDFVRAFVLTGDPRWVRAFADQLRSWEEANPFRAGANWASGQELAIRLMAWTFAVATLGAHPAFTDEDFRRFLRLTYRHAQQIDHVIDYARWAVHNNHLIGEALGLFAVGDLFPFLPGSPDWRAQGLELLTGPSLDQFYADGGYCQSSHNYQRLALHYLLWTHRLLRREDHTARQPIEEVLARSAHYLASFQNEDGRLPNRGANDGALLNPWTACDYADFRPLLSALRFATTDHRAYPSGPWDEELFWFFGDDAPDAPRQPYALEDQSFPTSGIHVLRKGPADFATFRCGSLRDRFAQADQLHVDLFWRGLNVAHDGGSYRYNEELHFHRWFMGTSSHNTVTVDDADQMELVRRFKWLNWTKAHCSGVTDGAIRGQHFGYSERGVIHHRRLRPLDDGWEIVDRLFVDPTRQTELTLHWLLADFPYELNDALLLDTPRGALELSWQVEDLRSHADRTDRAEITVERAVEGPPPRGWISRYYGARRPALSFQLRIATDRHIQITSRFRSL